LEGVIVFGYIYLTTNLLSGKRYIGRKKSSEFLGNAYLGSGNHLRRAVNKFGKENFSVSMIEAVYSEEDLYSREEYWIRFYNAVEDPGFYNHSPGGKYDGFLCGDKNIAKRSDVKILMSENHADFSGPNHPMYGKHGGTFNKVCVNNGTSKKYINEDEIESYVENGYAVGQLPLSEECKRKISESSKGISKGTFVNNGIEQHIVNEDNIDKYLSSGYSIGALPFTDEHKLNMKNSHADFAGDNNPAHGRKWINNGTDIKYVKSDELPKYISDGWRIGRKICSAETIESMVEKKSLSQDKQVE
jgi:group I intron endonuclease